MQIGYGSKVGGREATDSGCTPQPNRIVNREHNRESISSWLSTIVNAVIRAQLNSFLARLGLLFLTSPLALAPLPSALLVFLFSFGQVQHSHCRRHHPGVWSLLFGNGFACRSAFLLYLGLHSLPRYIRFLFGPLCTTHFNFLLACSHSSLHHTATPYLTTTVTSPA